MSDDDDSFEDNDPYLGQGISGVSLLHLSFAGIFPEWSSNRISRWLGINPRTLQRMLSKKPEIQARNQMPGALRARIGDQQEAVTEFELGKRIDDLIARATAAGIDDEVLAAWLAHRYKRLMGREID